MNKKNDANQPKRKGTLVTPKERKKQNQFYLMPSSLHDFSMIFLSPTGFDKSPTNARDRRQIGARSRE